VSFRCDRVSRSWFSCAIISSAARFVAARSWSLVAGEMLSRPSAHWRSASAYLASTQAIQGSSGSLSSLIDIRDLSLLQSRITRRRRSGKCVRIEVHDRDTRTGAGPLNLEKAAPIPRNRLSAAGNMKRLRTAWSAVANSNFARIPIVASE
jgi:hypothetical protein